MHKLSLSQSVGLALLVVFLWATSWVLIKIGLEEIPALTFAGLRYMLAFLCLLPITLVARSRSHSVRISRKNWGMLILLGLLFYALTQGASFLALAYLPAITVNLLWNFSSVLVALLGIALLRERPTWLQWVGIGLALIGALIFFSPIMGENVAERTQPLAVIGLVAAVVGVVANAFASILGRSINRRGMIGPLVVTTISMGFGATALLVTGLVVQGVPRISWQGWAIVAWLAVVNTAVAFTLWNQTLRTLSAVESSVINGTMLVWIPILAVVFLGEMISTVEVVGLLIVGVGVLVVQLKRLPYVGTRGTP